MRAHVIENNVVVNTIEVESLDIFPNLAEASVGSIGWSYIDGVFTPPVIPKIIPEIITMRQARLALLQNNLLDVIDVAVATMPQNVQISWEYATEVRRDNPLVASIKAMQQWTDAQMDDLFILASTL